MNKSILFSLMLLLGIFSINLILAHGAINLTETKELIDSGISCDNLTDEQLEEIGEYYMEQMHPGESHDLMHEMIGIEEGTEEHELLHINLAKVTYCGESVDDTNYGMGMMSDSDDFGNMMYGKTRYSKYGNFVNYLYIILLIGVIVLVIILIMKLIKDMKMKGGKK